MSSLPLVALHVWVEPGASQHCAASPWSIRARELSQLPAKFVQALSRLCVLCLPYTDSGPHIQDGLIRARDNPGAEAELLFSIIPLACGHARLPILRVFDKRSAPPPRADGADPDAVPAPREPELAAVRVVDERWDAREEDGTSKLLDDAAEAPMTILVLP